MVPSGQTLATAAVRFGEPGYQGIGDICSLAAGECAIEGLSNEKGIVELWETWNEERFYNFIRANAEIP